MKTNLNERGNIVLGLMIVLAVGAMIIGLALSLTDDGGGLGVNTPTLTGAIESARDFIGQSAGGLNCYAVTYANGVTETVCE